MRLFTAILFDENMKSEIFDIEMRLKERSMGGAFTEKENLHLTINFIGETKRLAEVKDAMNRAVMKAKAESFPLLVQGFGRFKREEGDIYWIGIHHEEMLWRLQKELVRELKETGFFDIDDREYKPHLTLGRRVRVRKDFDASEFEAGIVPMETEVNRLSLMKSERIEGKLTYTEVFHITL